MNPNSFGPILLDEDAINRDALFEAGFTRHNDAAIILSCAELTLRHVSRVAGLPVKLRDVRPAKGTLVEGCIRFGQAIVGDRNLRIAVDLPSYLLERIAQGMLGSPSAVDEEAAVDAACELVNVVGGNACTDLEAKGFRLRPEPPFWSKNEAPSRSNPASVRVRATAGDDPFELHLFVG